mmetsp:Transcript_27651/g.68025  ORF Transcript_27651/g.68025 Transcript_27651/m.68025 type:complete len:227 (+) Transcript_27651:1720-2400(+)
MPPPPLLPSRGKKGPMSCRPSASCPWWITPIPAVAEKRDQLVARLSQSRFSRRKVSTVVPACISALHSTVALWHTELRDSTAARICFSSSRSAALWLKRNSRCRFTGSSPDRTERRRMSGPESSGTAAAAASSVAAGSSPSPSFFSSVSMAASPEAAAAAAAVTAPAAASFSLTRLRNAWISFSYRLKPIWYDSSCSSTEPSTSLVRMAATLSASSRNMRHWHMLR